MQFALPISGPCVTSVGRNIMVCQGALFLPFQRFSLFIHQQLFTYLNDVFGHLALIHVCRFDGSGGDNNYDAGSCVDGRLTSAWNWCSKVR